MENINPNLEFETETITKAPINLPIRLKANDNFKIVLNDIVVKEFTVPVDKNNSSIVLNGLVLIK